MESYHFTTPINYKSQSEKERESKKKTSLPFSTHFSQYEMGACVSKPPVANNARLAELKAELAPKEAELAKLRVAKIAKQVAEAARLTKKNADNKAKLDAFAVYWFKEHNEIVTLLDQLDAEMCELQARIAECKPENFELAIEQLIKQREILAKKIDAENKKASSLAEMLYI